MDSSEFNKSIRGAIDAHSNQLIMCLDNISLLNFNPAVNLIDFELFIEPTRFEVDIMMFSMSSTGDEVFNERGETKLFAGSKTILSEAKFYTCDNNDNILDNDEFLESADEIEQTAIIEWFIHCWGKSMCKNVKLPAYVGFHDHQRSLYLQEKRWVDFDDKFPAY